VGRWCAIHPPSFSLDITSQLPSYRVTPCISPFIPQFPSPAFLQAFALSKLYLSNCLAAFYEPSMAKAPVAHYSTTALSNRDIRSARHVSESPTNDRDARTSSLFLQWLYVDRRLRKDLHSCLAENSIAAGNSEAFQQGSQAHLVVTTSCPFPRGQPEALGCLVLGARMKSGFHQLE
jgi:hypothetical protein